MTTEHRAADTALDRLSDAQRMQLDSAAASFAMENMSIPAADREIAARMMLGEVTFEEAIDLSRAAASQSRALT